MERNPYSGETIVSLDPTEEDIRRGMSVRLIDAASGEMTLLGHLPVLGPARAGDSAVWGPTGDVILGGYHLVIDQNNKQLMDVTPDDVDGIFDAVFGADLFA